jgi:hypothetical protein
VEGVRASFLRSPKKSTRRASRELSDVSHMTVWRVLRKILSLRPYKFQLLQELKPSDRPHWRNFCTYMLNRLEEDNLFLDKVVFSNKATLRLSGKFNRHDVIMWGLQNTLPQNKDRRHILRRDRCHTMEITFLYGYEVRILYAHVLYWL